MPTPKLFKRRDAATLFAAGAILLALGKQHLMIEGAGALSIAALVRNPKRFAGQTVVLIVSGSKLGMDTLCRLLAQD